MYKRRHARTRWATAHVWFGRIVITLGIINGGLGLELSGNTKKGEIAYGVVAGVVWLLWMTVVCLKRNKDTKRGVGMGESGEKVFGGHGRGGPASSEEATSRRRDGRKHQYA